MSEMNETDPASDHKQDIQYEATDLKSQTENIPPLQATASDLEDTTSKLRSTNHSTLSLGLSKLSIPNTADIRVPSAIDRHSLSVDILCDGFVDSFVEFFYLSHQYNENGDLRAPRMSEDELIYLKQNLVVAETCKRDGDLESMHSAYKNIADYFKQMEQYETALYFYEKCREVVDLSDHKDLQLITYLDLGLTNELLKNVEEAIKCHQRHLQLAEDLDREMDLKLAHRNLIRTFKLQADALQAQGKFEQAITVLEECLSAGEAVVDLAGVGLAQHTLGNIHKEVSDFKQATVHYKKYLKVCLELEDTVGEGIAYFELGKCFQAIGDIVLASKYFESYMDIAGRERELVAQSEACSALGDIYCETNEFQKAAKYYQQNFELSNKIQDAELAKTVRIKLGIAKANEQMGSFVDKILEKDLPALLNWKSKRTKL